MRFTHVSCASGPNGYNKVIIALDEYGDVWEWNNINAWIRLESPRA